MGKDRQQGLRRLALALVACGLFGSAALVARSVVAEPVSRPYDPVLAEPGGLCLPTTPGTPALLRNLVLAKSETAPFQPEPLKAAGGEVPIFRDMGTLAFAITTRSPRAQEYFNQGLRFAIAFNHAEALRAFQAAQRLDPECAMCFWGEAWVLGPNINAPMAPEALAPALAATTRARQFGPNTTPRENTLIEALARRYSTDPLATRQELDHAFADAMREAARRYPADDTIQVLYAEAVMDTQPWDYWEAGGVKPKARAAEIVDTLETVLKRNPRHPGAIHLYIHAVEASSTPERALPHARRLAALMPGAGHIVHMPAHIYYRVGLYRESLEANKRAIAVDEAYFRKSPSDPMYKSAYYPHNIHFVLVSAQMGGDAATAISAAAKLDAALPDEVVKQYAMLQPLKAASYATHAQFSDAKTILAQPAPSQDMALVSAMHHYSRALAHAMNRDVAAAEAEIAALAAIEAKADFKPFTDWGVPGKEVVQVARLVASARLSDARGDLEAAARGYEQAIAIEDALAYMEPPFWYYPIRQSLGSVRLRQDRLDDAEKAFRDSLARVRNNGWALAGLVEVYRKKGDAQAEKTARSAYARAWFGRSRPQIDRL